MFLEQGVKPENHFWKYLLGSVFIITASFVGQIPFSIAVLYKSFKENAVFPTDNDSALKMFEPNLTLFLVMLSFVFAFAGIYFVVKYMHHQTLLSVTTGRKKVDWNRILFSFLLWALFSVISFLVLYFQSPEKFVWNFKLVPFLILAVIGTILIPIQTSTEEYVFRGYLMQGFANLAKNKWFPLVMTSLIFGSMHILNPEVTKMGYIIMVYYIGTGLFLGIITLMDDGMELALGFHAANNLIGALLVTSDWSVFQTHSIFKDMSDPSAGADVILPVVIVYPILLFIFSKKYKWTNWKEKLTGKIDESENEVSEFLNLN
ncbi:CPBP family intramembrane glutamic endopeptidase [Flavobacterium sp. Root186]|uniref:CPBP family intramembrane glutamic endopeptidase n=1 Tax=Flavobacterium sp. Root186 TaxID=1736485 RepID=UPI0006F73DD4|nr:CPBP family intramembrane glutamic endopeptidase [Flavobacterium sp. Root186]KRB57917.1 abortive phage infection protein [Flavobacterium sp. Root186]